jgi:hypothetical protein
MVSIMFRRLAAMLVNYHLREGKKVGKPKMNKVRCLALRSCHQPPCVVLTMLADKQAEVVVELVTVVRTQSY